MKETVEGSVFGYEFKHLNISEIEDKLISIDMMLAEINHEPARSWTIGYVMDGIQGGYEFGLRVVKRVINDPKD